MDSQHTTILHQQSVAHETLTALEYADDVAILAYMIETGDRTAGTPGRGLYVNWSKMKIQHIAQESLNQWTLQVAVENVDLA